MPEPRSLAPADPAARAAAPSEDAVRTVVRRIVDATFAGGAMVTPAAAPASGGAPASTPAAQERIAIAIGADHGGAALKDRIGQVLAESGFAVRDCGTHGSAPVDYPDFAHAVARLVADGTCRWGVIVDGAGIGSCMVANKVPGVRAALCHDELTAQVSRRHTDANVLCLASDVLGEELMRRIVMSWMT